jgi:hypothetical protein
LVTEGTLIKNIKFISGYKKEFFILYYITSSTTSTGPAFGISILSGNLVTICGFT